MHSQILKNNKILFLVLVVKVVRRPFLNATWSSGYERRLVFKGACVRIYHQLLDSSYLYGYREVVSLNPGKGQLDGSFFVFECNILFVTQKDLK